MDGFIVALAKKRKGADARKPMGSDKGKDDTSSGDSSDSGGNYSDIEDSSLADMVDAMGLDDSAAEKFGNALSDYVKACVDRALDEGE